MQSHRVIWSVAAVAVTLAAITVGHRYWRGGGAQRPAESELERLAEDMTARLAADPTMKDPQTAQAVSMVAGAVREGWLESSAGYHALGLQCMKDESFRDAEAAFRESIRLDPDWSWPYTSLGILLANHTEERTDEAEAAFEKAIELDPDWSRPHNDLAVLLRLRGRIDEAERHARKAVELDPDNVATRNNYGNLLVARKRYADAEPEYRKALELEPDHPKPYYNLACLYSLQNRFEEALTLLERAIALEPALREDAERDKDFDLLRDSPEFRRIVAPKDRDNPAAVGQ